MKTRYRLNMELFEVCTVLMNCGRWKSMLEIGDELKKHKKKINPEVYDFLEYGVQLIDQGTMPEIRSFLLNEEICASTSSNEVKSDMRLVSIFLKWIQEGEFGSQFSLIQAIDEGSLNSEVQNWSHMNEFDLSITMKQAKNMTNQDWSELRDTNPMIRDYYDMQSKVLREQNR
ncbi:protein of unknown function [Petrocella atlantisensis]|uniref:Uncharacterized protein n=2 Tax=Petrocella atlantisensis TaxID=2173034 RepID=A0A3P7RWB0_9FIRM|nr:protein of unknown function [Petrocella atlantisensis]